jgi:hypothetical protein
VWSRDGRELFYRGLTDNGMRLIAAHVALSPTFMVNSRTPLFSVDGLLAAYPHGNYDVTGDGQRFVFVQAYDMTAIVVIQNLPALVRELSRSRQ